jgi:hypothetical protein
VLSMPGLHFRVAGDRLQAVEVRLFARSAGSVDRQYFSMV